jgi:hypothetical protein
MKVERRRQTFYNVYIYIYIYIYFLALKENYIFVKIKTDYIQETILFTVILFRIPSKRKAIF